MKRRISVVGALLSVVPLAFGVATATAAKHKTHKTVKPKPTIVTYTATCNVNTGIVVDQGDSSVTPPVSNGTEFGSTSCGSPIGGGVQKDVFTVPDSGDTQASFTMYFGTGTIRGMYDLSPQEGSFDGTSTGTNFTGTDYTGQMAILSGTGAYKTAVGKGTMTCTTPDGIHTSCTDSITFKVTIPPTTKS